MNLFDDIKSPVLLHIKGGLFAAVALLSAALVVFYENRWCEIGLLAICVWSSCRFYYYLFYVLENYIGCEKNASVFSMLLRIFCRIFCGKNAPIAGEIPPQSVLDAEKEKYDWFDSYRIQIYDPEKKLTPRKMCDVFLDVTPRWVYWLFRLRNAIASRFGLRGAPVERKAGGMRHEAGDEVLLKILDFTDTLDTPTKKPPASSLQPLEDVIEIVKIDTHNENELVVGADDWHLNFKGSLLLLDAAEPQSQQRWLVLTTVVKFKHFFGRLYFLPIKPFHKMIVRSLLVRAAAKWNSNEIAGVSVTK